MSKFGPGSLLKNAKKEAKHCWRTYKVVVPKELTADNKEKNFRAEAAVSRICRKVMRGNSPVYSNNGRIA